MILIVNSENNKRNKICDLNIIEEIIRKLNSEFDSCDLYHHSASPNEMFEFTYKNNGCREEAWEITCLGCSVASGGGFGLNFEDCWEDDYIELIPENMTQIYNIARNNAIELISHRIELFARADIPVEEKKKWIEVIQKSIDLCN